MNDQPKLPVVVRTIGIWVRSSRWRPLFPAALSLSLPLTVVGLNAAIIGFVVNVAVVAVLAAAWRAPLLASGAGGLER